MVQLSMYLSFLKIHQTFNDLANTTYYEGETTPCQAFLGDLIKLTLWLSAEYCDGIC